MKYLVMIQARCGSSRLPGKVLKDLCGEPILRRVIERAQRSVLADEVMVVTSIAKGDLPILRLCADLGVRVGVGSEDDVLDRYHQTARLLRPDYVIRLTADCPCFDAGILDDAIRGLDPEADYAGMMSGTFADGLDLEIVRRDALDRAWREADRTFEREHVTQYIVRRPDQFRLQDIVSPMEGFGDHRWTVDEPEDLELVRRIWRHFLEGEGRADFGWRDILSFLEEHPEIAGINRMYQRNEGLRKSIRDDRAAGPVEG